MKPALAHQIKSGLLIILAVSAELLPRTVHMAIQGTLSGYIFTSIIIMAIGLIYWFASYWHKRDIHVSYLSEVISFGIFLASPIIAWVLDWIVWPHVLVSILFLGQVVVIISVRKIVRRTEVRS